MLLVLVMVFLPSVLSVEISLSRDKYYPGETLQAEITGNFISLGLNNFALYKEEIPREMPVISGLTKRGEVYYFYAVLPSQDGNFSLVIEDAEHFGENGLNDENIVKNFVISSGKGNRTILRINPGFVLTEGDEFSINLKSLSGNVDVNAELLGVGEVRSLFLRAYLEETVKFSTAGIGLDGELVIGDYKIPVFIIKKGESFIKDKNALVFIPSKLEGSAIAGQNYIFEIIVKNEGDINLTGINFSVGEGKVSPAIINLKAGERSYLNVSISIPKNAQNFSKKIIGRFGNEEVTLPVLFDIIKNIKEVNLSGSSLTGNFNCSMQKGNICLGGEICDGDISPSLEGGCCKGRCVESKETNYGFYIGVGLLILVIVIVVFMIWRARKKGGMKMPKDILKERAGRGEEKMFGSKEVKGSLGKE